MVGAKKNEEKKIRKKLTREKISKWTYTIWDEYANTHVELSLMLKCKACVLNYVIEEQQKNRRKFHKNLRWS